MSAKIPKFPKEAGRPVFTGVKPEDVARYVILAVRDPLGFKEDSAKIIAEYLDSAKKIADTGMFVTYSGIYKDAPITVCSTGSGCPDTELALLDFMLYTNADTFLRIGTSGSFQKHIKVGEIVISTGAVRDEGTTAQYVKQCFPAIANYELLLALIEAAEKLSIAYHIGVTRSNDAIYCGLGRAAYKGYIQKEHKEIVSYWSKTNVANIDRETSLILTLTTLFNLRGGSVCAVVDNYLTRELKKGAGVNECIKVGLEGIRILYEWDRIKLKKGGKPLHLSMIKKWG
jgi:uridine phosphorylase